MRVTFVVPFVNLTGGIRAVLEYADFLAAVGHEVVIAYPAWPYRFHFSRRQQLQEFRRGVSAAPSVGWTDVRVPVRRVPLIRSTFLPPADVVVATSWPTVYDVARLHRSRGAKVHLLMHYEADTGPPARVARTLRLPLARITFSQAVADELAGLGCTIDEVVPSPVSARTFFPDGSPRPDTVMMLYHPEPRKGGIVGLRAFETLRRSMPDLRFRLSGTVPTDRIPRWVDVLWNASDTELRRMYSSSTAFLYPSVYEGFGLPPLEAMACGCPVVTTPVGAIPEYAKHGCNALVVPIGDDDAMATALADVARTNTLRTRLSQNGKVTAREYAIERIGPLFESALQRAARRQGVSCL
jgi:glycosyltransferase involved in cell wall biosynthesis